MLRTFLDFVCTSVSKKSSGGAVLRYPLSLEKMACQYGSDSSSDENEMGSEVGGYRFQPLKQGPVLQDRQESTGDRKDDQEDPREVEMQRRLTSRDSTDWCRCGRVPG